MTEFIEGKSLNRLMEENPDKTGEYMELFTRLHIELGKKRCPMMCRVTDKITEKVRRSEMKATLRFGLYSLLGSMEHEYDLCHGDFVPANVIIGPDGGAEYHRLVTCGGGACRGGRGENLSYFEGDEPCKRSGDIFEAFYRDVRHRRGAD